MKSKVSASIRVEREIFDRFQRIAIVDRRSISEVIRWAAECGLPALEAELAAKEAAIRQPKAPHQTAKGSKVLAA